MPRPPASPTPPPASFPFTAGNFDFPHASPTNSPSPRSRGGRAARRTWQSFAASDARQERTVRDAASATRARPPRRTMLRSARRSTLHRLFGPPRDSDDLDDLSRRPTTANPNRPRAQPSERYLRRSAARISQARADMEAAADLLDSLSDVPIGNPFTFSQGSLRAHSPSLEAGGQQRRAKRRKLDHTPTKTPDDFGYKYGYKGQTVPGRLQMAVESCDGGEYSDKNNPVGTHAVHNVLRRDQSVYCSESPGCNLLLRHRGDVSFALERIVIRAPDRGFTAPYVNFDGSLTSC